MASLDALSVVASWDTGSPDLGLAQQLVNHGWHHHCLDSNTGHGVRDGVSLAVRSGSLSLLHVALSVQTLLPSDFCDKEGDDKAHVGDAQHGHDLGVEAGEVELILQLELMQDLGHGEGEVAGTLEAAIGKLEE
eukprot:CAMPEP_0175983214 /NCGR_PEP_ID=MMETSP0108-20121206/48328_1 /TAXON_ID=195067 ORGANISM="Goniomonas pacifica, Strain CCMP1869" /NCGR_SAMPLE_ID=MMETSP0108 /ASSEMBLY_ACC=CAM_ASM_000204 /LENGTH=133 /DNA_ID=CAMNT_0017313953 /DNA_START=221 /DNA_END=622 /DNA_ORIENTATION=+